MGYRKISKCTFDDNRNICVIAKDSGKKTIIPAVELSTAEMSKRVANLILAIKEQAKKDGAFC